MTKKECFIKLVEKEIFDKPNVENDSELFNNAKDYFMALKDASQLVKMYAMVNVSQYQIVAVGSTVEECQENYAAQLTKNGLTKTEEPEPEEEAEVTGRIAEIRSAVMEGDTCYFIRLQDEAVYYIINGRII